MKHDLYKDGDADIPKQITDSNGQVVLSLCKRCNKAECELDEDAPCIDKASYQQAMQDAAKEFKSRGLYGFELLEHWGQSGSCK